MQAGHVWVYRSDVVAGPESPAGAVVDVADERGRVLGTALFSNSSVIALRLIARKPVPEAAVIAELLPEKIRAALAYREGLVHNTDGYRLIFSEGDALPGLIADRYNDLVVIQVLNQAFDRADFRAVVVRELGSALRPRTIFERVDARIRALEKLPPIGDRLLWSTANSDPRTAKTGPPHEDEKEVTTTNPNTIFTLNRVRSHFNALSGQKTGAFLDQRENYAAVERYAHGEALDCFCYQGGFALHLARACTSVTGVDSSRPALETAEENAQLNGLEIDWIEANAFDLLKDYAAAGRLYDTIVLDPPAFAKGRSSVPTAIRGYKELNLRALKMLRPGGILATCSCSHHVSEADFMQLLASAAADARRTVRILERRGGALDHPAVLTIPETSYLKCFILLT